MSGDSILFVEAIEAILRDRCTGTQVRAIEKGDRAAPEAAALWAALEGGGYLELMAPEAAGGAALDWAEVLPVFTAFGGAAMPLPAAQTIAARALLWPHGVKVPQGPIALAGAARRAAGQGSGDGAGAAFELPLLPGGRYAAHVIAAEGEDLVLLDAGEAARIDTGVIGSARATLRLGAEAERARVRRAGPCVAVVAAACQAALLVGAMQRCLELTLLYVSARVQFGRPIGRFQAVQHQLAVMAEAVVAARLATISAFLPGVPGLSSTPGTTSAPAPGSAGLPSSLRVAVAKARASEAAPLVANSAHAMHGAIGITAEYDLQLLTRRLHDARMADGSEAHWHRVLGEALLEGDASVAALVRELSS